MVKRRRERERCLIPLRNKVRKMETARCAAPLFKEEEGTGNRKMHPGDTDTIGKTGPVHVTSTALIP